MPMPRDKAARLGRETVAILHSGGYTTAGRFVPLEPALSLAREGTVEYPPTASVPQPGRGGHPTQITVERNTTLEVSRRLACEGRVAALNFASAREPGGGFLTGARAQEEGLARSSGLYACLVDLTMYPFHHAQGGSMYSNYVVYSPDVPVFRTDGGQLLDEPWPLSIVTSPAANQARLEVEVPDRVSEIPAAMEERVDKVLRVAAAHGHDRLVLGAWGCGAFGIPGAIMAPIFRDALRGPFAGVFRVVVFAITDSSPDRYFIGPFEEAFGTV